MKRKSIIIGIIVLALIIGGGIAIYYNYENSHYVTTEDAQNICRHAYYNAADKRKYYRLESEGR